jgi:8-oxo-dGTP pyrophosphatase MutT (NUDIX family)
LGIIASLLGRDGLLNQYAALPVLRLASGEVMVCLITSRGTGRWLIPKGWPKGKMAGSQVALEEAREEAGLEGVVGTTSIGKYVYRKRLHIIASVQCEVEVFPLEVTHQLWRWRERDQRKLRWCIPDEAAAMVQEPDLAALIKSLQRPS